jgi:restriction system protein
MSDRMWMVRGDSGNLFDDFHDNGCVAIGWHELATAQPGMSRTDLFAIYRKARPEFKTGTITSGVGQVWRFLNEIKLTDWVVTYNPSTRKYLVGEIYGEPKSYPRPEEHMTWTRDVTWHSEIDRDALSAPTKRALGPTLTIFQISASAATEIRARAQKQEIADIRTAGIPIVDENGDPIPEDLDDQEEAVRQDVEAQSIEFIKDRISKLDWDDMQELVAGILRAMGYKTRVSPPGSDRGVDIIASPDGLGFSPPRIVVEVKHRRGQMGSKEVRSFLGGRHNDDRGLFVSTGGFSKEARYEGDRAKFPMMLWELDDIVRHIVENYEALDAATKQLVPLKRLYWPA